MDAYIGWPGKVHDARVLVNSSLYQMQHLQHYWNRRLCGVDISLIILGDPAYPLLPWLMKPYIQNGNTSGQQRLLNDRQSRARMTVENTFGKLKGRWRCLMKRMDVSVNSVPNIAARCVTLHNFCVNCTMITVTWSWVGTTQNVNSDPREDGPGTNTTSNSSAAVIRDAIAKYLSTGNTS